MKAAPNKKPADGRLKVSPKTVLKEVVIPSTGLKNFPRRGRRILPSQSPESSNSGLSSLGDRFSDSETPDTSAVVTPADSLTKRETLPGPFDMAIGDADDSHNNETGASNKRKRVQMDEDNQLAEMLQNKEYQKGTSGQALTKRRRKIAVENSEDEPSLSDVIEDLPSETDHRPRASWTSMNSPLPTRAARESAKKSIKVEASRKILDSESDDPELSEYKSDEELDEITESEANEDDLPVSRPPPSVNQPSNPVRRRRVGRVGRVGRSVTIGGHPYDRTAIIPRTSRDGNIGSWRHQRISRVS